MAADASAYTALGLEPGADAAAVERAYKRLIKQHHPDREGGDAERAAEINRAYRELRSSVRYKDALEINCDESLDPDSRVRAAVFLLLAAGALTLLLIGGPLRRLAQGFSAPASPSVPLGDVARAVAPLEAMDQPLVLASIDEGVRDAVRIARSEDELALASASRDCHRQLRVQPSMTQLDRCAAFDNAVIQLQDRDPLRDRGPFSELAVTGRLMSGATLFSNDYLAIDGRLDQIRVKVELALAPPPPPETPSSQTETDQAN